jgi:hypothetical protein
MFPIAIDAAAIAITPGFSLAFAVSLVEGTMRRKLLLSVCAAGLAAASLVFGAPQADAHGRYRSQTCVVVDWPGAWLRLDYDRCDDCCCRRPRRVWVQPGRAFRVVTQSGPSLRVWHLQARGWIKYYHLRFEDERLCLAAGI